MRINNIIPKRTFLEQDRDTVHHCYVGFEFYNLTVFVNLYRWDWLGMHWYTIKKYRPRVGGQLDGHYATRERLKMHVSVCKLRLKELIRTKYEHPEHR